jgi:serine protease Do
MTHAEEETMRTLIHWILIAFLLACAGTPGPAAAALPVNDISELVATLLPSVVNISVVRYAPASDAVGKPLADGSKVRKQSFGSGYIVDRSGVVLTNRHVTDGAEEIAVILNDGTELRATLAYRSPDLDLAMLSVHPSEKLHPIKWGDSDRMREGMPVIAIGNPLGVGFTVTAGIVSARDRDIKETAVDSFIQIDAAINPGNSGGPLFNAAGEAIGMNTALYTADDGGGSVGLGLAIPGNDVQFVLNNLREYGRVRLGYLGATAQGLSQEMALAAGFPRPTGVILTSVKPDSPAAAGGLQVGDIVLTVGGDEIRNVRGLTRSVAASPIGELQTFHIRRGDNEMTLPIKLAEAPSDPNAKLMSEAPKEPSRMQRTDLGLEAVPLDDAQRKAYKIDPGINGVVVTAVMSDSESADLGFMRGDVVRRINGTEISTLEDVRAAVQEAQAEGRTQVLVLKIGASGPHWLAAPVPPQN